MKFPNWKTSLIAALTSGLYMLLAGLQQGLQPKDVALSAGILALGLFMKDFNITGIGTKATSDVSKDTTIPPTKP